MESPLSGKAGSLSIVLAICVPLLLASAGLASCSGHVSLMGSVVDAVSGQPIAGAKVVAVGPAGRSSATTDAGGRYSLERLQREATVSISAERYHEARFDVGNGGQITTSLEPLVVEGTVTDGYTGQPLAGARVEADGLAAVTDQAGVYRLVGIAPGSTAEFTAAGYYSARRPLSAPGRLDISLRPNTLKGTVVEATSGKPIAGATVIAGAQTATTAADGSYSLAGVAEELAITVKAPGYDDARAVARRQTTLAVTLRPFAVRGAYLTYYGVGDATLRGNVLRLIDDTELNAVVIDVKGDFGKIAYKSDVPLAEAIGANSEPTIADVDALLSQLREKGIYSIARIVVFKDDMLGRNGARAGVDVAVRNASTGGLWIDGENLAWVDPFREEVWDYNIALAVEAVGKGFDEIQFDYIRFPTDPSPGSTVNAAVFSRPSSEANRTAAIEGFLAKARAALKPLGAALSVDVFGYTCWREDDMGIGQRIEGIAEHVDFLSPMVYPSTYSDGLPMTRDYRDAPAYPYEIVYYSVKKAVERLQGLPVKVRPWLQYFDDYPWASGREYNAPEIVAQKQAAVEAGGLGYLLWDPTNRFSRGGLEAD